MRVVPDPRGPVIATTPAAPKLSCPKSDSRERTASSSSVATRTTMPCSTSWGGADKQLVTLFEVELDDHPGVKPGTALKY